ncbi:Integrase family protein [Candidatus Nitrotoga sp. HW29]|uniref:tyrosine-type recombinase/integrase n=1 Tax=Candidatus Nitrotoga sp. HW29 TaxID=2886963 RepID=UPI001EF34449|nr:integrase arm-type DNA-binding domain-containing protein [Candidatus Nitrotoga sp. HW29]CAH1905835.1 Integrase family protein [Candidatus Nitrotoga sp. HW29]
MPLTEMEIKKAKATDKPYKLTDGGGLFLLVHTNGGKYWRLRYRVGGKEKLLAIGVYPDVTLSEARERREQARKLLANGADPSAVKQEAKQASHRALQVSSDNSFATLAAELHKVKSPMWTPGHAKQWLGNLEKYAFAVIGHRPIAEIEPMELVGIMRTIEEHGTFETRDRLLQSIGAIFKYAIATGRAKYNPAEIRMALVDRPKVEHFNCIPIEELSTFLRAITAYQDMDKVSPIAISALRLLMLTATRTSEVRYSKWKDFDLDAGCWVIPAEQVGRKGKGDKRKDHAVPLSIQAVSILRGLIPITSQGEYVFPNRNYSGKVISENTVLKIIETIGYKGKMTGHGFRSLARTVLGDMGHRWEVLEAMLSHALVNQTAAAYVRTSYFEERRGIMQQWADYLAKVEAGAEVIPLRA